MSRKRCPHCRKPLESFSYKIPKPKRKESAVKERSVTDIRPILPYRKNWRARWRDEFGV